MANLRKFLGSGTANPKQVIVTRKDLDIGKGKLAAHVAHASLEAYKKALATAPEVVAQWEQEGQKKIVVSIPTERDMVELFDKIKNESDIPCALIKDAGHTQIAPGTITALGLGPWPEVFLDKFTNNLKLL